MFLYLYPSVLKVCEILCFVVLHCSIKTIPKTTTRIYFKRLKVIQKPSRCVEWRTILLAKYKGYVRETKMY